MDFEPQRNTEPAPEGDYWLPVADLMAGLLLFFVLLFVVLVLHSREDLAELFFWQEDSQTCRTELIAVQTLYASTLEDLQNERLAHDDCVTERNRLEAENERNSGELGACRTALTTLEDADEAEVVCRQLLQDCNEERAALQRVRTEVAECRTSLEDSRLETEDCYTLAQQVRDDADLERIALESNLTDCLNVTEQIRSVFETRVELADRIRLAFEDQGIELQVDPSSGELLLPAEVLFPFDDDQLIVGGTAILREMIPVYADAIFSSVSSADEIARIVVEGHTSSSGDDIYNMGLSTRRANAVVAFVFNQLPEFPHRAELLSRIAASGRGEIEALQTEDRPQDRRVVLRIEFRDTLLLNLLGE